MIFAAIANIQTNTLKQSEIVIREISKGRKPC